MKAYQVRSGVMHETDVPDGVLLLEHGSSLNPAGGPELPPIVAIDHVARRFRRRCGAWEQIPERSLKYSELPWRPV